MSNREKSKPNLGDTAYSTAKVVASALLPANTMNRNTHVCNRCAKAHSVSA